MLLGEILIKKYDINPVDIDKGLQFQQNYGGLIGAILINMGVISEDTLVSALSEQLNLKTIKDYAKEDIDFNFNDQEQGLNIGFLTDRSWLPIKINNKKIIFASRNPLDYEINQYLGNVNIPWEVFIVTESQFRELEGEFSLTRSSKNVDKIDISDFLDTEIDKLKELASEAPVVNLVNSLIARSVSAGASDLHFEPYKNMTRVRFRIDGILHDIDFLPMHMHLPISSRIKILSGMDIAERRRPQDGQISMKVASKDIDIRVSTLPLSKGESLVLRFLLKESVGYELDSLGLEDDLISKLHEDILKTAGVILLTGPTGSGKTTSLYSCLNKINSEDKKIITIEDPVEYQLDGINQIQVHPEIGYDFLSALRSILRQDPDIIMIGEIRDGDTARVAMQSSLTGHLVFSTIHTNDAPTAYTRLIDLGVEEYLINSSLISVIGQRLVRKLCATCSQKAEKADEKIKAYSLDIIAKKNNIKDIQLMNAKGCNFCSQTGYKGRVGIMEYLRCTNQIKGMPKTSDFIIKAKEYMEQNSIRSLYEDGMLKVIKGVTSMEEVLRVCG
ncbi:MAG: Flp pilus assembly complex ATPase component TadA [Desulfobacterales bacterium]|nr:Flp pilus assembly complex ATPase component TadA [Desulfobacterales bacterium]